jgi:hypothetical protein
MTYQNEPVFPPDMQHYACRFMCIARAREVLLEKPWLDKDLISEWAGARSRGIISGDLNHDGDFDDPGEDEILNDQDLFDFLEIPLKVAPLESLGLPLMTDAQGNRRIAPSASPLDPAKYWTLEKWIWRIGHFIQGDGTGKHPAIYDPIRGGSFTRANGHCESLRVYLITAV